MRYDHVVGVDRGIGKENTDEHNRDTGTDRLGDEVSSRRAGCDPGERIGEHAPDSDGGISEGRGAREPVRSADVCADGRSRQTRPAATGQREYHGDETSGGNYIPCPAASFIVTGHGTGLSLSLADSELAHFVSR